MARLVPDVFQFKCTQGMRYLLKAINETVCVIISRVDAMCIQRARVFCKLYAVSSQIPHRSDI